MKTLAKPAPDKSVAPLPDRTPEERAALATLAKKRLDGRRVPTIKLSKKDRATQVSVNHPDQRIGHMLLMDALGTSDWEFFNGVLSNAIKIGTQGGTCQRL